MGKPQTALIYAFVARGTVILAEHTDFSGNFNSIAHQCLQKLPASNNKFTYNCDGHTFNYLVDEGFTYCVVAEEASGRQIPMAYLERIKEDFVKKYGGGKAATAPPNSLNKEFGSKLKEHMKYCVEHPDEISKIAKVKAQVSEVKGVMMENIEKDHRVKSHEDPKFQDAIVEYSSLECESREIIINSCQCVDQENENHKEETDSIRVEPEPTSNSPMSSHSLNQPQLDDEKLQYPHDFGPHIPIKLLHTHHHDTLDSIQFFLKKENLIKKYIQKGKMELCRAADLQPDQPIFAKKQIFHLISRSSPGSILKTAEPLPTTTSKKGKRFYLRFCSLCLFGFNYRGISSLLVLDLGFKQSTLHLVLRLHGGIIEHALMFRPSAATFLAKYLALYVSG